MAAQNNSDRPQWMDDIDKKADTRARRLMNARGKDPRDSTYQTEFNLEVERIRNDLLGVHYSQNPQDKDSYQQNTSQQSTTNNASQPTPEETIKRVETQSKRAQTALQALENNIPSGIPIVSSAIKYKAREERALQAITTGIDPETGETLEGIERIKRAAQYEAESIKAALSSATEIATLSGSTSTTEALSNLREIAGSNGVNVLIDNAPSTLRKLAAGASDFRVANAIRNSAQTLEILAKDPTARAVMIEIIQGSRSIADLRSIVTNDARLQEVLISFENQINSIPRFKENSPPDIPPPPVIPPGTNQNRSTFGLLAIQVTPQRIETNRTAAARERTREYRENINQAGNLQFSRADLRRLKELYPDIDFTNKDLTAAIHLGLMGVNAERLAEKARRAEVTKVITETEQVYLTKISRILRVYNEANPELASDLEEVNGIPQVVITRVQEPSGPPVQQPSETGTMIFRQIGDRALQPLVKRGNKEISKKVSGEVAKKFAKTATKQVAKKAASTVGAEAGAAAGSIIPVVGNIIGAVVGWLVGTVLAGIVEAFAKRAKDFRDLAGGIIIGGGQAIGWVLGILWAATVSIGQATIAAIIAIPLFVIFAMYVINTSAWVIPPWSGSNSPINEVDSAFIDVTKVAEPTSVSSAPATITYTITITAEQSALTNVSYTYDCSAVQTNGSIPCPPDPNVVEIAETTCGTTIPATESCTFSYTVEYGVTFDDSIVIDTITVTADAEGLIGEVSNASASVIIGDAPTACFALSPEWNENPTGRATMLEAIASLMQAGVYVDKLCEGGVINVDYSVTNSNGSSSNANCLNVCYGGWTRGASELLIYPWGVNSLRSALRTIVHESGHIYALRRGADYSLFVNNGAVASEGNVCTYRFSTSCPDCEDFAESISLYFNNRPAIGDSWSCLPAATFDTQYPSHWSFMGNEIYEQSLGW